MHADPHHYQPDVTICAQCGEVRDIHVTMVDTGETLHSYCRRIEQAKGIEYHCVRWGIYVCFIGFAVIFTFIAAVLMKAALPALLGVPFLGAVVGWLAAVTVGRYIRLGLCRAGVI